MSAAHTPESIILRDSLASTERLLSEVIARAGQLHALTLLPDLEKCALAAARAADCLTDEWTGGRNELLHELRNHIGAMSGYLELLLEDREEIDRRLLDDLDALRAHVGELLTAMTPEANTALTRSTTLPPGERGTLLVIDDNELSRELLGRYLRRQGHAVLTAASGAEAMAVLGGRTVDLIFLDLVMPEMSGLELLTRIKSDERLRAVPVIIVSGIADDEGVIRCIEAGADDYLSKPFNPTLLQARLNAGLERKRWHDREEAYRRELERNQRFIRNTFGRYLSDEIVDALLETPQGLDLGGVTCKVTILMADIRNFTHICESHTPQQVVKLLNNYLGAMSSVIMEHRGTVDEFIGDGILAIFGAPIAYEDDARRAVRCALAMQQAVHGINARNRSLGLPPIAIGIGLNTGLVVAGNIGSERRSKYGVVGHTVNLTARIESLTTAGEILGSQNTVDEVGPGLHTGRCVRTRPKGMAAEVTIHAITGLASTDTGQEQARGGIPA
ncbi:MAG: response regulator [Pseudomonadales bacterium]|nr:response regulator [Pseudomonadales bacterium]MCP5319890.1 response regulator [Pseudomonadales bacterium]MCP5337852.1 response regulator [Pseudomonadales bacterium]